MARMKDRGNRRSRKSTVVRMPDLSNVEGKRPLAPIGKYPIRVVEVTSHEGDAGEYWKWVFEKSEGKGEGARIYHNTSLADSALWNLRSILESLGADIPDGEEDVDLKDFVGMEMVGDIDHEQNDGFRKQARIVDHEPIDDEPKSKKRRSRNKEEGDDNEERTSRRSKRRGSKREEKKEELTADAVSDMDEDELKELIEEHELDVDLDDFPTLKKKKTAVIDAATEAGVIEE